MPTFLSKSDFKVARTCATKLYYRKLRYPSKFDDDPYLEFLANGGYMVEVLAKLLFPEGKEIEYEDYEKAVVLTQTALQEENVTLFEATFMFKQFLARIDILEKHGNHFRLIEVKSKGFNSDSEGTSPFRGKRGDITAKWTPYLEDVTFQTFILRSLFPNAQVVPHLCLVDKSTVCSVETTFKNFSIKRDEKIRGANAFNRPTVTFTGNVDSLRRETIVRIVDVTPEVDELLPEVRQAAETFAVSFAQEPITRIEPQIQPSCKKCEYRVEEMAKNGFRECWGALANTSPHLLDFYRVDALGKNGEVAAQLISEGRCSILDISKKDLRGKIGERQAVQLEWTQKNEEFISPQLSQILGQCKTPLHFIDFETSRTAVPYHVGMHPYEQVAFQWSCHTLSPDGKELAHYEWINIDEAYPNFQFARALQKVLNPNGTVFIWSPFERTALKDIRRQLIQYNEPERDLAEWLDLMVADQGPLVDLCQLAREHYFHPRMAGSVSIKYVLPAVWFQNAEIRNHPWFSKYVREKDGKVLEPYETLDPLPFGDDALEDEAEAVQEGTGAIRTYQEMMYGLRSSDQSFRQAQRQQLLDYCKLDTAAMVMIWMHWMGICSKD